MPRPRSLAPLLAYVSLAAFLAFLFASAWLGRLERGGPPHADLMLEGSIPATLFLPATPGKVDRSAFFEAPPRDARPPVVVLAHGMSSDRANLSGLARRLAGAGIAVLTLDLRGHGANRNPFPGGWARADALAPDFAAAVDFLRTSPLVDGSHIALMGHSMGAGAALDFATRDSGLDAVVAISGGWSMLGPQRAPNVLFLYASGDPERIHTRTGALAARLAGIAQPALAQTYGDFRQGTSVRRVEVPGVDHLTILWSDLAVSESVAWLDEAFGRERRSAPVSSDPRGPVVALLGVLLVLMLPGLGQLVGRLTPTTEHLPDSRRPLGLALLALALLAAMPLAATGSPGAIVSVEVADVVTFHFALAGIALLVLAFLHARAQLARVFATPGRSLLAAALGSVAIYALLQPFGLVLHRVSLTPERMFVFGVVTLGFLPLELAMQMLLRRGRPLSAALYTAAGRVLVLLVLIVGVAAGVLASVVLMMLPALALVFVLIEVLDASIYLVSRNLLTIAVLDAAWIALIIAAIMPVRI